MRKTVWIAVAVLVLGALGVNADAGNISTQFDATLGGYVKLDYINQTFNAPGMAAYGTLTTVTPANEHTDQSLITARQTRIHLIVTGPDYLGATTRAFIEGDFFGPGGTNERGNVRMRHANFTLDWKDKGTQVMFGQFWDIYGPFAASMLDFGTGGNIGGANNPRIAQLRVTQKVRFNEDNWLTIIAGLEDPQQNDSATKTNVAGQVLFQTKALGVSPGYWGLPMDPLTLDVYGLYGKDKNKDFGNKSFDAWSVGFYTHVPILKSSDGKGRAGTLSFEGQTYIAEGLPGIQGTQYLTLNDASGNVSAAKGYAAIGQLIFYPVQQLGITAGYGRRGIRGSSDYRNADSLTALAGPFGTAGDPAGAIRKYNDGFWTNVTYDVANVRLGAEYMHLSTKYLGSNGTADANRFQVSAIYFF